MQLVRWYGRLIQGDLGQSIFLRKPVTEAILDRVEPTLLLTLFATLISVTLGVPRGDLGPPSRNGHRPGLHGGGPRRRVDPELPARPAVHPVLLVWLGWFPVAGYSPLEYATSDAALARHARLRAGHRAVGPDRARGRSSMLDVLREQFITAGRAKGLAERAVSTSTRSRTR
jgi:peptide/nickel transport system permease protein